jgi:hypothetical protein
MLQYCCAVNTSFVRTVYQNGQFDAFCFFLFFFTQINVVLVVVFNVDCFLHLSTHLLDYQMNL